MHAAIASRRRSSPFRAGELDRFSLAMTVAAWGGEEHYHQSVIANEVKIPWGVDSSQV